MTAMTSPASATEADTAAPELAEAIGALEAAFSRITHVVKRHIRDFATGIHPELRQAGWVVLGTVLRGSADGHPVTAGDIVAECGMDKSVVSRQLRSLSDWGLVELSRSDADARVVVVTVTPLARERVREVRGAPARAVCDDPVGLVARRHGKARRAAQPARGRRRVALSLGSSARGDDARADELLEQSGTVGREEPAHRRLRLAVRRLLPPAREDRLARGELPDADRGDAPGVLPRELRVDLLVVLAVVAEEQPADVRELAGEPPELPALVLAAVAEEPVGGRTPVGEQERAGRVEIP